MLSVFSSNRRQPPGVIGKVWQSFFFLFFGGMGLAFFWLAGRDVVAGLQSHLWKKTDCEIISSSVADNQLKGRTILDFQPRIIFRYEFNGQTLVSEKYRRTPKTFSDYGEALRLCAQFPAGAHLSCYVNPAAPAEAVLHLDSFFAPLILLFPLVFVAIGAGGIFFTWRSFPTDVAPPPQAYANAIKQRRFVRFFFAIFLLLGGAGFYLAFVRPMIRIEQAKNWPEVPCVVVASQVDSHRGSKGGTTYNVNILYRYQIAGRDYKANRYGFMGGSSSGYSGKQAIVAQHPPGSQTVCYVNPADPTDAVLERRFTPEMWFGLIPLVFVVIGFVGLIRGGFKKSKQEPWSSSAASKTGF